MSSTVSDDIDELDGRATSTPISKTPASPYRRMRRYVYELLLSPTVETSTEQYLRIGIGALIALNVIAIILESVPEIAQSMPGVFITVEVFSIIVFTTEYLLRLWAAVEDRRYEHPLFGRLRYAISFFALVDLASILPFFLPAITSIDLRFIRALRLTRLLRVIKLGRYASSFSMMSRVLRNKREEMFISCFMLLLVLLISSSLMYFIEHEAQPDSFPHIPAALWWGIATLTTIGYGDIYPVTAAGKVCAAVIAVLGIGLVALPSGILVAGFVEELQATKEAKRCPHCGEPL